jgi:hypothetical protein
MAEYTVTMARSPGTTDAESSKMTAYCPPSLPAQTGELTPETRRALVEILRRAARRGRELREARETVVNADPGRDTSVARIAPTPQDGTH